MIDDLKKLDEPWLVGYVPETGELVFAPIRGPQHENLVHLKSPAWVCKACRATLMRRDALVDYWGNVYHKSCFPYEEIKTKLRKELQDGAKAAQIDTWIPKEDE